MLYQSPVAYNRLSCLIFLIIITSSSLAAQKNTPSTKTFLNFEIVIPSYNNIQWVEKNLCSVCLQIYPTDKYHITYVNDASTDGTGEFVAEFIYKNHLENRITLINNKTRKGQLENRYRIFHALPNEKIIVECDGDDFFENDYVLSELNEIYQDQNVWMLYTIIYKTYPNNKVYSIEYFSKKDIENNLFRDFKNKPTCQLRSYYAWLFKQVKLKDLLYEGHFYSILTDSAYMIPMLEMAREHNRYVDKILYLRNITNPLSVKKSWSQESRQIVYEHLSAQKPYNRIKNHKKLLAQQTKQRVEIIICGTSLSETKTIANLQKRFSGFNRCTIFLESREQSQPQYQSQNNIPDNITFIYYNPNKSSLQKTLKKYLFKTESKYIVFLPNENIEIDNPINVQDCVSVLKDTFAEIFYLQTCPLPVQTTPCVQIKEHVWASQFVYQRYTMNGQNTTHMALLCSKKFLSNIINTLHCSDTQSLNNELIDIQLPPYSIRLFFTK